MCKKKIVKKRRQKGERNISLENRREGNSGGNRGDKKNTCMRWGTPSLWLEKRKLGRLDFAFRRVIKEG